MQCPPELIGKRVVWSNEHSAWWRANSCGYVTEILGAGLYTLEEAEAICAKPHDDGRADEVHFDAWSKWKSHVGVASPGTLGAMFIATSRGESGL